jgi:predicted transcriptional regulator
MKVGVTTCHLATPVRNISKISSENDLEAVIIISPEDEHAIGKITQVNVMSAFSNGSADLLTAMDIMQEEIEQVLPDIPVTTAAQMMLDKQLRIFFIMHHSGGLSYGSTY